MLRNTMQPGLELHEIFVVMGICAVTAYEDGENDYQVLSQLGKVLRFEFPSVREANAFIRGIELAQGQASILPVEDIEAYA